MTRIMPHCPYLHLQISWHELLLHLLPEWCPDQTKIIIDDLEHRWNWMELCNSDALHGLDCIANCCIMNATDAWTIVCETKLYDSMMWPFSFACLQEVVIESANDFFWINTLWNFKSICCSTCLDGHDQPGGPPGMTKTIGVCTENIVVRCPVSWAERRLWYIHYIISYK